MHLVTVLLLSSSTSVGLSLYISCNTKLVSTLLELHDFSQLVRPISMAMPHRRQGLADHHEADFLPLLQDDLDALVELLGDKAYVTGEFRCRRA